MRFTDLLRTGVLLSAASATMLATGAVLFGILDNDQDVVLLCTIWWLIAATGALMVAQNRAGDVSRPVSRLLADARQQRMPEEPRVGLTIANRLWPLGLLTFGGLLGAAIAGPQVAGLGAGFPIVWALLWRGQESAVKAIEGRDGVTFHVERTSPMKPITLVRGPGLRRDLPTQESKRTAST
ncbi:MAG: hypothetical protein Q7T55_16430 [Solirubrobacteraceae bacterium]|nr:hypothetical protein [Solirubrobacteraceae bacterium]